MAGKPVGEGGIELACLEHRCTTPGCGWFQFDNLDPAYHENCPMCGGRMTHHFDEHSDDLYYKDDEMEEEENEDEEEDEEQDDGQG